MLYMRLTFIFFGLAFSFFRVEGEQYTARFEGCCEEFGSKKLELIAKFLPDDPVVLDAGGLYGNEAMDFFKKWPNGTILSFEPNPHAFDILLDNTKDASNIYPFNLALNTYNGMALLFVCYGSNGNNPIFEGASSLLKPSDWMAIHYQGPKIKVPCVVLDDWCKKNQVEHIDLMWLGIEGSELQVLKSSPEILKTIKVIHTKTNFLEFRQGMTQYNDLKKFLENSGFKLLSHWYAEGFQGSAIFVRKDIFNLVFRQFYENPTPETPQQQRENIRIICTSALIPYNYEMRKEEYILGLQLIKNYGYDPYVFEACSHLAPTFLEEHANHVFYSNLNDPRLINKGVNEATSMLAGFNHYQFNDDDMIIKLTGRYHLVSRDFIQTVEDHPEVDIFVKADPNYPIPLGYVYTGCFAMRYKLFKQMLEEIDLVQMEKDLLDIERVVANFAKKFSDEGGNVMYMEDLGLSANVGSPYPPIIYRM